MKYLFLLRSISKPLIFCLFTCTGFLGESYSQDQKKVAVELVRNNLKELALSKADVEDLYVSDAHTDRLSGALIVYLQQQYKSINVHNALYSIAFKNGKVLSANNTFVKKIQTKVNNEIPVVSPDVALSAATRLLNITTVSSLRSSRVIEPGKFIKFDKDKISRNDIPVKLVWVVVNQSSLRLAWEVHIDPIGTADMWNVRIDASKGIVLNKDNWTKECRWDNPLAGVPLRASAGIKAWEMSNQPARSALSWVSPWSGNAIPLTKNSSYLVIPFPFESPLYTNGLQIQHDNPWLLAGFNNPAVSYGWHHDGTNDYAYTRGNNVFAQEDMDRNSNTSGYVASSTTSFPSLNFQFPLDFSKQPIFKDNALAAVTNLFYWNNIMHDISYQYGFDEAAGNFQKDNMGRGGLENDFVQAEAQDASFFNNANFAVPPDGSSARMQMFLWNPVIQFIINSPVNIAGNYSFQEITISPFNLLRVTGSITGNIVLVEDNETGTSHLGCIPSYTPQLSGNIAVIERGSCPLSVKIKNAQNAGAVAVIIINTTNGPVGAVDSSVTIPAVLISEADGVALLNQYLNGTTVNISISVGVNVDGDLDNGIIAHEYSHGISSRLTGGPGSASCLANVEQMGEGWSDYYSLMITTDWSTAQISDGNKSRSPGNYALNKPATSSGIRTYPYSTDMTINPHTYGRLSLGAIPHELGEVWCATLWDMTWDIINADAAINSNLYNANGNGGNSVALKLVTLGLKLQPCNPGFIDGRNAILKADSILYNGKYSCVIWKAFARRGMGVNASQGGSDAIGDEVEDFKIPAGAIIRKSADKYAAATGDIINYNLAIQCQCAPLTGLTIRDTLAGNVIYQSGGTLKGREILFPSIDIAEQQTAFYNMSVKVNESYSIPVNVVNEPVITPNINPEIWTREVLFGPSQWTTSNAKFRTLSNAFFAIDSSMASDFTITSRNSYPIERISTLSFWHSYDTEIGWDGGVVELSTNDGLTWVDAGPFMTENSYPSSITILSGTGLAGLRAFTGSSGPLFMQTIIDLSSFAGQSVKFRFRFVSDALTGGIGWFIDDILLRAESGVVNNAYLYLNDSLLSKSSAKTYILGRAPLQMTFDNFNAVKENETGLITWLTSNDFNSQLYEVEKSFNGIDFQTIGAILSSGRGAMRQNYQFIDTLLATGMNYYRLKQIDLDGKATYTAVKFINVDETKVVFFVTPNPSSGIFTLSVPSINGRIPLQVFDGNGRLVFKETLNAGNQKLNLSHLSKGVYILQLNTNDKTITRKVVIQ